MQACKMAAVIYAFVGLSALVLLGINGHSVFGMGPDPVLDAFSKALGMPWILAAPPADSSTEMLVWEAAAIALNVFVIIGVGCLMRAKR
jgi:hypothetical protein